MLDDDDDLEMLCANIRVRKKKKKKKKRFLLQWQETTSSLNGWDLQCARSLAVKEQM
jgi:hypothetical protein